MTLDMGNWRLRRRSFPPSSSRCFLRKIAEKHGKISRCHPMSSYVACSTTSDVKPFLLPFQQLVLEQVQRDLSYGEISCWYCWITHGIKLDVGWGESWTLSYTLLDIMMLLSNITGQYEILWCLTKYCMILANIKCYMIFCGKNRLGHDGPSLKTKVCQHDKYSVSCLLVNTWLGGFLKWWVSPTNPWVFLLKMIILGCEMGGNPPFKETPIYSRRTLWFFFVFSASNVELFAVGFPGMQHEP